MSPPAPRAPLQQRVADAILGAAAGVLARRGHEASMNEVAAAAGVARATLYRYFSSRQALVEELADVAIGAAGARLASARIDEVAPEEAIVRAVRALVDVGAPFLVVARERVRPDPQQFEHNLTDPLRRMVERAQRDGVLREDLPAAWLAESLVGLLVNILSARPDLDREDVVETVTSLFLDGARARASAALRPEKRSA
jgi:TetR/AcrR family transcriptional regulator, mexCD-oprJ operon repressor